MGWVQIEWKFFGQVEMSLLYHAEYISHGPQTLRDGPETAWTSVSITNGLYCPGPNLPRNIITSLQHQLFRCASL